MMERKLGKENEVVSLVFQRMWERPKNLVEEWDERW